MEEFFKQICSLVEGISVNIDIKPKVNEYAVPYAEEHPSIRASDELLGLSLKNFMEELMQEHKQLQGEVLHAVITDNSTAALFCTSAAHDFCKKHGDALETKARLRLGVENIFIIEIKEDTQLTEDLIEEAMLQIENQIENEAKNKRYFRDLPEAQGHALDDVNEELYCLEDLFEIVAHRGLDKVKLPADLCHDILEYLWNEELSWIVNGSRKKGF